MVKTIMKSYIYKLMIESNRIIDVGERNVVMATKDYGRGKPRFILNLPTTRNDLWELLWRYKVPIKVFIEIPEDALKKISGEENAERSKDRA